MAVKVFLLGRPGSGKSTAARYIEVLFDSIQNKKGLPEKQKLSIKILNDYFFLREMHLVDKEHKQFKPVGPKENEGFDVIDFQVFNTVLERIKEQVFFLEEQHNLILIEFARSNYRTAFQIFGEEFLRSAYFLFFKADLEICQMRINERTLYPASNDDHFLSEDILFRYYRQDDIGYITNEFIHEYAIDEQRVAIIDSMGSWKDAGEQVKQFALKNLVPKIISQSST